MIQDLSGKWHFYIDEDDQTQGILMTVQGIWGVSWLARLATDILVADDADIAWKALVWAGGFAALWWVGSARLPVWLQPVDIVRLSMVVFACLYYFRVAEDEAPIAAKELVCRMGGVCHFYK